MVKLTTMRIWIGISIAWPFLCMLMFNKWFFFSPLGLLITFVLPVAGWALWWKFYREEEQILAISDKLNVDKGIGFLTNLKKRLFN